MAFPTVASLTETTVASMTTTHNISLGATVNAGDLLLMIFVGSQVGADQLYTITKPTGFKRIWDRQYDLAAQNRQHVAVFAKKAVGDEDGTTVNVATSASVSAVAHVYRIDAGTWFGDLKAIACSPYTQAEAANPNPASLTVPWGSADNLWLAIAAWEDSDFFASAAPASYTNLTTEIADSTEDAVISSARRENAVATEDPGTFTATSEKNLSLTIGIAPSGATMPTFPVTPTVANGRMLFTLNTAGGVTRTFPSLSNLLKSEGELLVAAVVTYDGNSTNAEFSNWGGGFQEFKDQATTTTMGIGLAYKFSDGAETGTFTVTVADASTTDAVLIIMSFPWAHDSTPPEAGDIANGTTTGADAPSLSPSWGAEATKWVWVGGVGETGTAGSFTGFTLGPDNWITIQISGITADVVGGVEAAVAFRELNAASADAGAAVSVDTSNTRNSALLFAVRPAAQEAQPVAINLTPVTITLTPSSVAPSLGAVAINLTPVTITLTPSTTSPVAAATAINLVPVTITLTPSAVPPLTAVVINLVPVTITLTPSATSPSLGALSTDLTPVAFTLTPSTVAPTAAPTAINLTAVVLTLVPSQVSPPVAISLTAVVITLTPSAVPPVQTGSPVEINLTAVTITLTPQAVAPTVAPLAINLTAVSISLAPQQVPPSLAATFVDLVPAILDLTPQALDLSLGALAIELNPVALNIQPSPVPPSAVGLSVEVELVPVELVLFVDVVGTVQVGGLTRRRLRYKYLRRGNRRGVRFPPSYR